MEIRSPELLRRKFPHNFLHAETVQFCQLPHQFSLIDVFVGIQAQDKPFAIRPPLLHLVKEILPESSTGTGVNFQFLSDDGNAAGTPCQSPSFYLRRENNRR